MGNENEIAYLNRIIGEREKRFKSQNRYMMSFFFISLVLLLLIFDKLDAIPLPFVNKDIPRNISVYLGTFLLPIFYLRLNLTIVLRITTENHIKIYLSENKIDNFPLENEFNFNLYIGLRENSVFHMGKRKSEFLRVMGSIIIFLSGTSFILFPLLIGYFNYELWYIDYSLIYRLLINISSLILIFIGVIYYWSYFDESKS